MVSVRQRRVHHAPRHRPQGGLHLLARPGRVPAAAGVPPPPAPHGGRERRLYRQGRVRRTVNSHPSGSADSPADTQKEEGKASVAATVTLTMHEDGWSWFLVYYSIVRVWVNSLLKFSNFVDNFNPVFIHTEVVGRTKVRFVRA